MKHLVLVTGEYPPQVGGVAHYCALLKRELSKQFKVRVVNKNHGFLREIVQGNNCVLFQYVPHMYERHGAPIFLIPYFVAIKLFSKRLITTVHEKHYCLRDFKAWSLKQKAFFPIVAVIQRAVLFALTRMSDAVITYDRAMALKSKKVFFAPVPSNLEFVKAKRLKKNNTVWLTTFAGQWREIKRILNALQRLEKIGNIQLNIVGKCSKHEAKEIFEAAERFGVTDKVNLTGVLPARDLKGYLEATDVFIALGGSAGASLKSGSLSAAMEIGLPIISNQGRLTDEEIHRNHENMVLLGREESLSKAIETLIGNPGLRRRLGEKARQTYYKHACWRLVTARYLEAIAGKKID